jgi:predicted metal-dependent HD superfamily phosphohydrolase
MKTEILEKTEKFVQQMFDESNQTELYYHSLEHTTDTVKCAEEIAETVNINDEEKEIVLIAAWFHDVGYLIKYEDHEATGAKVAEDFLNENNFPLKKIDQVKKCILSTRIPQKTDSLLEQIVCDADLAGLSKKNFFERTMLLRKEWEAKRHKKLTDEEYLSITLKFMREHNYLTQYADTAWKRKKKKNIKKLREFLDKEEIKNDPNANISKIFDNKPPDRGIETMFRNNLRGHLQLSAIADNKANIMLSINAIIISIVLSNVFVNLSQTMDYIFPTILLLIVCITTMIFATISTMPKVTTGTFTTQDIENKTANLLFFGNFHNMDIDEFQWGMKEMMKDRDFLYGSMMKDFYYLGKVLQKKYKYLRICYLVFMYGLIATVISFLINYLK